VSRLAPAAHHAAIGKADLAAWLLQAVPGERIAYWRGHLAFDAGWDSKLSTADRRRLLGVAGAAAAMAQLGWVHLLQQRHGSGDCTYLAVARPRPPSAAAVLALVVAPDNPLGTDDG
jgi:hypothetical protein